MTVPSRHEAVVAAPRGAKTAPGPAPEAKLRGSPGSNTVQPQTDQPSDKTFFCVGRASRWTVLDRADRIAEVCAAHRVTLPQAAMAFPLTHLAVTCVVLGMRSAEEVRQNVNSFATPVPAQLRSDLCAEGLLDERVPIPS